MSRVLLVPDLPREQWPSMDRYASRLAQRLPEVAPDFEFELAGAIGPLTGEADDGARLSASVDLPTNDSFLSDLRRYFQRYVRYPRQVRRRRADLIHVLDHSYAHVLRAHPAPAVVTVHDLLPVMIVRRRVLGSRERLRNLLLGRVLAALREARAWIVATDWLRGELATWLERDDGIHVVPYGVDDGFFEPAGEARAETRRRLGLPEDAFVVLHVGSVVDRKNIPAVTAAVAGARARGVNAWLLQVGGRFTRKQQADVEARALGSCTVQVAEAPESALRAAYRTADVLLFPSLYEGFGLPVLEAMAAGLPVITSGAAALTEVAGDAAVVVPSRDPERYVDALLELIGDPAGSEKLRERGRARARGFRWADTARRTAEVYRRLVH